MKREAALILSLGTAAIVGAQPFTAVPTAVGRRDQAAPAPGPAMSQSVPNTLTPKERADGWRLLSDGKTASGWRGYRQPTLPSGWQAIDGALTRVGQAGDIVTIDEFGDFELTLEWKLTANGNSGVFYRVVEDDPVMWHMAPEYQIIDNAYNEPLKPGHTPVRTTIWIRRHVTRRSRSVRGTRHACSCAAHTSSIG